MRLALAFSLIGLPALAEEPLHWVAVQEPVFGQIVMMPTPTSFGPGSQNETGDHHILEVVPKGETVDAWSQIMTITGYRGLAAQATPEEYGQFMARRFHDACPSTFFAAHVQLPPIRGAVAQSGLIIACGTLKGQAETAAIIILEAAGNIYTLRWSEHGPAIAGTPKPDWPVWNKRFELISIGRLCPQVAGETAPYASCGP